MRITILNSLVFLTLMIEPAFAHNSRCAELLIAGPAIPNEVQRQIALGFELSKLRPPQSIIAHQPRTDLENLSEANTNRILARALKGRSRHKRIGKSIRDRLDRLLDGVQFVAIRPIRKSWMDASYDDLTQTRHTIGFRLMALPADERVKDLKYIFDGAKIVLKDSFARNEGFIVPLFTTTYRIFKLFEFWSPELAEDVARANRYSLPQNVRTAAELKAYLSPSRMDEVFPNDKLYQRLAPFREALHQFAFTLNDAETMWVTILRQYLLHMLSEGVYEIEEIEDLWSRPTGADHLFAEASQWLGFEGFSLRIPLNLNPENFQVISGQNRRLLPKPGIDHDSMPD